MKNYFRFDQKFSLFRSLVSKMSPAYIQFYVTARCDMMCEQCNIIYADADAPEMTLKQIRAMAENMAKIGVCIVLFIGGEPFIRKDLPDVIRAFTEQGIHVRLQTNGLATREQLLACVEAGAHDISISLDSLDSSLQDQINGVYPNSWDRTIEAVAAVNEVFPENGSGFFGTVLMPRNLYHIRDVIEFATIIGWSVSLVPAHVSSPDRPLGFRTFDDENICTFPRDYYHGLRQVLNSVKELRRKGLHVYDSDEYLDDIYRFVTGGSVRWRRRNGDICDSPNLYFGVEPNGNIRPCCDYKLPVSFPVYHEDFPKWFRRGDIHRHVYAYTRKCAGCMYGSYPEITVTARYYRPFIKRYLYFNKNLPVMQNMSSEEMKKSARMIFEKNREDRERSEKELRRT
ncbi:MAG: radical SAM protein [Candidatus Aureabacteria bacterium]|nr:radical SAM protein [Candidatus Auribacterota bacterium]